MADVSVFGIKVVHHRLLDDMTAPVKKYKPRWWQTAGQANRIQKRWTKRYGKRRVVLMVQGNAYAGDEVMELLRGLPMADLP